ncbi:YdjM family protein [Natronomonas moolapensis 8.8.11]|uniref:YdjM family protein n=1 Tax=Natronomonas moolapensis (strain DSM 18674 / CECT 7526 / JCM 14361 / 8.8.11) TaxID=268739 RepID=M1Y3T1_NATM8|nr:metal-dependent hydrolase [Natronomonas moolapensis]CCQ37186.1 YdjM family protein [Natronomonas moolapensis 8.8.11]
MPSSVVHAALAAALAVGLLGRFYDRRALAVVLVVVVVPEVDTALGLVMAGAHRTVLHTMVVSAVVAPLLYWETTRADSAIRSRWGARGVRIAWVGLLVHAFAHVALDWTHLEGINLLWPVLDRFFTLEGEMYLSASEGFVQTFVDVGRDPETGRSVIDAGQGGTRAETHVSNPAQPDPEPDPGPVDRRFPVAVRGWQLHVLLTGAFVVLARRLQSDRLNRCGDRSDSVSDD